jgi:hypothetical protein
MFEAFVGSFLGMSTVLAILTIKDRVEGYRESKRREFEKRVEEAARARTKTSTAW